MAADRLAARGSRIDGKDWKLFAGETCLADFGPHDEDASMALAAVQYYRFTEQVRLRQGPSTFALYLSGGRAPSGVLLGLSTVLFDRTCWNCGKLAERG